MIITEYRVINKNGETIYVCQNRTQATAYARSIDGLVLKTETIWKDTQVVSYFGLHA